MTAYRIRMGKDRKLLLLGCPVSGLMGRIALGPRACTNWHIAVKTDNFQHPHCIDFRLSAGRSASEYGKTDTSKYSKCYVVHGGPGDFDVLLRWQSSHSPYPQIKDMEVWCFGVYKGNMEFPKAGDDYRMVAHVEIADDGHVSVDGRNAGVWPEFAIDTE